MGATTLVAPHGSPLPPAPRRVASARDYAPRVPIPAPPPRVAAPTWARETRCRGPAPRTPTNWEVPMRRLAAFVISTARIVLVPRREGRCMPKLGVTAGALVT